MHDKKGTNVTRLRKGVGSFARLGTQVARERLFGRLRGEWTPVSSRAGAGRIRSVWELRSDLQTDRRALTQDSAFAGVGCFG